MPLIFIPPSIVRKREKKIVFYNNEVCNKKCIEQTANDIDEPVKLVKNIIQVAMLDFYEKCVKEGHEVRVPHIGSFQRGRER